MVNGGNFEFTIPQKAYYEGSGDIILVDKKKIGIANESRLWFEVTLSITTALLGTLLSSSEVSKVTIIGFCIFLLLTLFFLRRYFVLSREGRKTELKGAIKFE